MNQKLTNSKADKNVSNEEARQQFVEHTDRLSEDVTKPISGARKIYVQGSREDIQVPMREITQSATNGDFGNDENPPITVYDTSGPYTCLLYTSPSPRDLSTSRMPSSA